MPSKRPLRVGRSRTGLGLFATAPIKKRQFIARYWGRRIPSAKAETLDDRYMFEVNSRWTIDGSTRRNIARYINHSCRPNAQANTIRGQVIIRATKCIRPGEEITYNYGRNYFRAFIEPKGCKCAACARKKARLRSSRRSRRRRRP